VTHRLPRPLKEGLFDRRVLALLAFLLAMAAYVPRLSSSVWYGDNAEAQTVPYILGIAHPTGFPAFTLAGWLFGHVAAIGTVAWRMNLFSALCVALTASAIVLIATALESGPLSALLAALAFAFGGSVAQEAILANVHVLATLAVVAGLFFAVAFVRGARGGTLVASCGCAGLGLATHPLALWILPGIVVAVAWRFREITRACAASAVLALLVPLLCYGYFPLRSSVVNAQHLDPTAAAPLFGAGSIDWDTNHPRTLDGFLDEVFARSLHPTTALQHSLYPSNVLPTIGFWLEAASDQYPVWVLLLAAIGVMALAQRERRALSVIVAGSAGGVCFASVYHLDADLAGYLLVSFAVTAVCAAASSRLALKFAPPKMVSACAAAALALGVVWALVTPPRSPDIVLPPGQTLIDAVRRDVPDGAIVVAPWYDAATLGYGEAVEGSLGSRTIVAGWPGDYADRYAAWSHVRPVVLYLDLRAFLQLGYELHSRLQRLPSSSSSHVVFRFVRR
jgi:hypothetical protein